MTTTTIAIFSEYQGLPLPELPFPTELSMGSSGRLDYPDVFYRNVKVFETDPEKRKVISEIYVSKGFTLETDHITSVIPNVGEIHAYDRLVSWKSARMFALGRSKKIEKSKSGKVKWLKLQIQHLLSRSWKIKVLPEGEDPCDNHDMTPCPHIKECIECFMDNDHRLWSKKEFLKVEENEPSIYYGQCFY